MKIVIRTVFFHLCCILFFGLIYLIFKDGFSRDPAYSVNKKPEPEVIDCLFLATTVQAGVGYSDLYPITNLAKTILIIQQLIMICTNVFLIYVVTL